MSRETGIDITTLASVLGPDPVVTAKDAEERFLQITSLEEALRFCHWLPKGSDFSKRARKRHFELLCEAIEGAVSVKDWYRVAKHTWGRRQSWAQAMQMLEEIFSVRLQAAGEDFKKLLEAYKEFDYPGKTMRKFRQELIRRMALHYILDPIEGT
jgi:hypothetical protein